MKVVPIPDTEYETKLATAIRGGYVPDVVDGDDINAQLFIYHDAFDNLTPLIDKLPFRDKLAKPMLSLGGHDGRYYSRAVRGGHQPPLLQQGAVQAGRPQPGRSAAQHGPGGQRRAQDHQARPRDQGVLASAATAPGLWGFTIAPSAWAEKGYTFAGPHRPPAGRHRRQRAARRHAAGAAHDVARRLDAPERSHPDGRDLGRGLRRRHGRHLARQLGDRVRCTRPSSRSASPSCPAPPTARARSPAATASRSRAARGTPRARGSTSSSRCSPPSRSCCPRPATRRCAPTCCTAPSSRSTRRCWRACGRCARTPTRPTRSRTRP